MSGNMNMIFSVQMGAISSYCSILIIRVTLILENFLLSGSEITICSVTSAECESSEILDNEPLSWA